MERHRQVIFWPAIRTPPSGHVMIGEPSAKYVSKLGLIKLTQTEVQQEEGDEDVEEI